MLAVVIFLKNVYLLLETGEGRVKERERNSNVLEIHPLVASCMPPRDLACNLGMCPGQESNQQLFSLQALLNPLSHTSQSRNTVLAVKTILRLTGVT